MRFLLLILAMTPVSVFSQAKLSEIEGGTSVFSFITRNKVWITADTKIIRKNYLTNTEKNITGCKIHKTNNYYYAFAGNFVNVKNDKGDLIFSAEKSAQNEILKLKDFDATIEDIDKNIRTGLEQSLNLLKNTDKDIFNKKIGTTIFDSFFISFVDGIPKSVRVSWRLNSDGNLKTYYERVPGRSYYTHIGYGEEIDRYVRDHPDFTLSPDDKKLIQKLKKMIELEIPIHGNKVGLPIDVIAIDKNGVKWLTANHHCF